MLTRCTRSTNLVASLAVTITFSAAACGDDKSDEPASSRESEDVEAASAEAESGDDNATAAVDAVTETLEPVLGDLLSSFGETVETGVAHSVEGGEFDVIAEYMEDEPVFHLTLPVDPSEVGRPLPVVAWANGGCLRSDFLWQKGMFDLWASNGYAILALTGTAGSDDVLGMVGFTTSAEQRALVDWVEQQNESGPYEGIFDLDRIVFAGNSCGGITSLEAASLDERAAAVFVLSGSSGMGGANTEVMDKITVPVAYVVGGEEDIAGANASFDYEALAEGIPAMIAHRFEGDHLTVSSDMMIVPDVGKIGLSFMNLALFGKQSGYDELTSDTVCTGCAEGHWTLEAKHLDTLVE